VPCITEEVGRAGGSARAKYTDQVQEYPAMLAKLIDNPDRHVGEREAILLLGGPVGRSRWSEKSTTPPCPNRYWPTPQPH
jgi:hypothetical protein